jgi:hypothetical protein
MAWWTRLSSLSLLLIFLTCNVSTAADQESPLEIGTILGGDSDDELLLFRPSALVFTPVQEIYILNSGDCTVLHLSSDWEHLNTFGAAGEGPGEFNNPTGMVYFGSWIWVFEAGRLTRFNLDGTYFDTIVTGNQLKDPVVIQNRLYACLGSAASSTVEIDVHGSIVDKFGMDCPDNFFESFKTCGNFQILPHADGRCLLLSSFDGVGRLVTESGQVSKVYELLKEEGEFSYHEDREEGVVSMSLTLRTGRGCRDGSGRYWLPVYEDEQAFVSIYDKNLKPICEMCRFPGDAMPFRIFPSPSGEIILVDEMGSTIYICRVVMG